MRLKRSICLLGLKLLATKSLDLQPDEFSTLAFLSPCVLEKLLQEIGDVTVQFSALA